MFTPAIPYLENIIRLTKMYFQDDRNHNLVKYHIGGDTT